MLFLLLLAGTLSLILLLLNLMISKKSTNDREKLSPFECGFSPKASARLPFSLRFYLVAVVFLVFDVEIALILPMPIINKLMKTPASQLLIIFFIFTLLWGLYHEWNQSALDWDL